MSRIDDVFRQPGHKALIAYVTVGYPSLQATLAVVPKLARAGCDIIELGIPFSDPLADGATIQRASHRALEAGITPEVCLSAEGRLSQEVSAPIVLMTYLNPVLSYGLNAFCDACHRSGVSGLIVPDLPVEEAGALELAARNSGIDLIYLAAPTSTDERLALLGQRTRGFLYVVSVAGVTGARTELSPDLMPFMNRLRRQVSCPLCIGFGISTAVQAGQAARLADGVIIGSRIVQLMEMDATGNSAGDFMAAVRKELDADLS